MKPVMNSDYQKILSQQKEASRIVEDKPYKKRREYLELLKEMITEHEESWLEALKSDLGKSSMESYTSEIAIVLNEIDHVQSNLKKWLKPKRSSHLGMGGLAQTRLSYQPYGSVLIISPWNYPLQLTLMPLIGALAAGNSCVIKPSEFAPATSGLLAKLLKIYFDAEIVTVIEGDNTVAEELLTLEWDFIFFTGSKRVGKKIHQAAAERQIPVVLELGGKNPCIVDETNLTPETIRQIVWGKFLNAGQTCIAPDTVYVHESIYLPFLEKLKEQIVSFYGDYPEKNADYGRISHQKHLNQLKGHLQEGSIFYGGDYNEKERYFAPTILTDIPADSPLMDDEIFGPILPVIPYSSIESLVNNLKQKPVPLVVYVFSKHKSHIHYLEQRLLSGAFSLNQVIRYAAQSTLPFGGVKESGFGRYHGLSSIHTFSYQKVCYTQKNTKSLSLQYPPYKASHLEKVKQWRKRLF